MNDLTTLVNATASGWIAESANIMSGDVWTIVYFFLGLTVIGVALATLYGFLGRRK